MKIDLGDGLYLPRPGAPHMDNLTATMIVTGNRSTSINLDLIAGHQGFCTGEFSARYAELEALWGQQRYAESQQPTDDFGVEGK